MINTLKKSLVPLLRYGQVIGSRTNLFNKGLSTSRSAHLNMLESPLTRIVPQDSASPKLYNHITVNEKSPFIVGYYMPSVSYPNEYGEVMVLKHPTAVLHNEFSLDVSRGIQGQQLLTCNEKTFRKMISPHPIVDIKTEPLHSAFFNNDVALRAVSSLNRMSFSTENDTCISSVNLDNDPYLANLRSAAAPEATKTLNTVLYQDKRKYSGRDVVVTTNDPRDGVLYLMHTGNRSYVVYDLGQSPEMQSLDTIKQRANLSFGLESVLGMKFNNFHNFMMMTQKHIHYLPTDYPLITQGHHVPGFFLSSAVAVSCVHDIDSLSAHPNINILQLLRLPRRAYDVNKIVHKILPSLSMEDLLKLVATGMHSIADMKTMTVRNISMESIPTTSVEKVMQCDKFDLHFNNLPEQASKFLGDVFRLGMPYQTEAGKTFYKIFSPTITTLLEFLCNQEKCVGQKASILRTVQDICNETEHHLHNGTNPYMKFQRKFALPSQVMFGEDNDKWLSDMKQALWLHQLIFYYTIKILGQRPNVIIDTLPSLSNKVSGLEEVDDLHGALYVDTPEVSTTAEVKSVLEECVSTDLLPNYALSKILSAGEYTVYQQREVI